MIMQELLNNRYNWQKRVIEDIIDEMYYGSYNNNVDIKKSKKLITVFGTPQIGKTTLILFLMGIKDCKFNELYQILRADIKKGNSSTATAMMYSQSTNNSFGINYDNKIKYYNEIDFKNQLKKIRYNVENGKQDLSILNIYIPKDYYLDDDVYKSFHIIDLPGYGSRNIKESSHVKNLYKNYCMYSNLSIIACKANEIQSLESLPFFSSQKNWYQNNSKYIIVTTCSYSEGNIKKTLNSNLDKSFYDYITDIYQKEVNSVIKGNQVKVFPIDIGESFKKLIEDEIKSEKVRQEVINTQKRMRKSIISAIQERKGNILKAMAENLQYDELQYIEDELKDIEQKSLNLNKRINKIKKDIINFNEHINNMYNRIITINNSNLAIQNLKTKLSYNKLELSCSYKEEFNNVFKKIFMIKKNKNKISDKTFNELINKTQVYLNMYDLDESLAYQILIDFYNSNIVIDTLTYFDKNFFFVFHRQKKASEKLDKLLNEYNKFLSERILKELDAKIEKNEDEKHKKIIEIEYYERVIKEKKDELTRVEHDEITLNDQKSFTEKQLANCKDKIGDFKFIVEKEFLKEKKYYFEMINNCKDSARKVEYLLFLQLIECDFKKIIYC